MTRFRLLAQSLRFHGRSHAGLFLGAAVASAVLMGALLVGDSVRGSLRDRVMAGLRLPEPARLARLSLSTGDRFFTDRTFVPAMERDSRVRAFAALSLPATLSRADGSARVNEVHWIHPRLGEHGSIAGTAPLATNGLWLNTALASALKCSAGDEVIVRIRKPTALPADAILTPKDDQVISRRVTVTGVLPEGVGNFQSESRPEPPFNVFQLDSDAPDALGLRGRYNLMLVAARDAQQTDDELMGISGEAVKREWRLEDADLFVRSRTNAGGTFVELSSPRIFLDVQSPPEVPRPSSVLTYLVNSLRVGERMAPYSMVTATDGWPAGELKDEEILINSWLADDLKARVGDTVEMAYYRLDSAAKLQEITHRFRIREVLPLEGRAADPTLMPEFPGLSKAESTHDWDAGFELIHKIRDQDEAYWKKHRGTPKAWVSWNAGQRMWANRFGDKTAIRFPIATGEPNAGDRRDANTVERMFRQAIEPASVGLTWIPVASRALTGVKQGQDFGQLFLAFSFFLVVAALGLVALLGQLAVEQRRAELGTLLATGWTPNLAAQLYRRETFLVAALGTVPGALLGAIYAWAVLLALRTIWSSAVAGAGLGFHATPATLCIGWASALLVIWITVWWALRRQFHAPVRLLLQDASDNPVAHSGRRGGYVYAAMTALIAAGLGGWAATRPVSESAPLFFGTGALVLIAGILGYRTWLQRSILGDGREGTVDLTSIAARAPARKPSRSLTTVALLASAVFVVLAVGANKLDANADARKRSSGTGGFAFWGESAHPITRDLNEPRGREFFGLNERKLGNAQVLGIRMRPGDDASCLNLQRAQRPRLLGVPSGELAVRGAFRFTKTATVEKDSTNAWRLLRVQDSVWKAGIPEIPVVGDANSLEWALHLGVGDVLEDLDERGRPFRMRIVGAIANSIWQGSLLMDESAFTRLFPSDVGNRVFLVEVPPEKAAEVAAELSRGLGDLGLALTPTTDRLNRFNAVQNTYLDTFQVLGGLGLLLGSVGLAVVAMRNLRERRGERAVLRAIGFPAHRIASLVRREHFHLLLVGIGIGAVAAVVSLIPLFLGADGSMALRNMVVLLCLTAVNGVVWTLLATRGAGRLDILKSLRGE